MARLAPKQLKELEARASMLRTVARADDLTPAERIKMHIDRHIIDMWIQEASGVRRVYTSQDEATLCPANISQDRPGRTSIKSWVRIYTEGRAGPPST